MCKFGFEESKAGPLFIGLIAMTMIGCGGGGGLAASSNGGGSRITVLSLPPGGSLPVPRALSSDGSVVAGWFEPNAVQFPPRVGAIWDGAAAPQVVSPSVAGLEGCELTALSPSGSCAVGYYYGTSQNPSGSFFGLFFWSMPTGAIVIPPPQGLTIADPAPTRLAVDDSVNVSGVVGFVIPGGEQDMDIAWSPGSVLKTSPVTPITNIPVQAPPGGTYSFVQDVSQNGLFAVGEESILFPTGGSTHEACLWNSAGSPGLLGFLNSAVGQSVGLAVSNDGTVAIGTSQEAQGAVHYFLWTAGGGMQDSVGFLQAHGATAAWSEQELLALSGNGKVVAGTATVNGQLLGFVVGTVK